jgi:hypothetical protein
MRESLFEVIKELEGFEDAARVTEAGMLQDELREAMVLVSGIRSGAAAATVARLGLAGALQVIPDSTPSGLRELTGGGS